MSKIIYTPPETFSLVEPGIYRSETLKPSHFPYLKLKPIKTLLVLSPEAPSKALTNFLAETNIQLIHLGVSAYKAERNWKPISEELVKEALELILDKTYHPILITCTTGIHDTGAVVGCLRKIQDWNFNSIVVEYRGFTKGKARFGIEQFIELFDLDLIRLPSALPDWFLYHQKLLAEEKQANN